VQTPEYCALGEGQIQSVNAWIGPRRTVTPLHTDPHHNLLCQVYGTKAVVLFPPSESANMYPFQTGLSTNSSQVDARRPDLLQFPGFANAAGLRCVLRPGQVLYLPVGWWHYVESLSPSISVSFWWQ
jgi:lysine-specific demethylase 8